MCNLFLDIILFAILLIFMVLLMILPDTTQTMYYRMYYAGLSSLGVPGVPWHTQILADQLTPISTRADRLCPPNYYWHTRILRPSDGPAM